MEPLKLTLDTIFGLGAGFMLGNSSIQRQAIDIEIEKQLILAKKDSSEKAKEIVNAIDDFRKRRSGAIFHGSVGLAGLYGIMNMVISRSTTAGMDSYITAIPAALTGNLIAKAVNRYRDRQKYADFKVIKEVANGYRSIESLLSEEQVHAIRQTSEKLEESIMSGKKLNEKEFNETLRETIEVFDKNPRVYFPLIADWTSNHIKEKIDTFFLQRQLKEFYEFSCPEGTSAISCGYFGEGGKNKVRLYSREGDKLNIGIIEWKNLELITEGGENTGIKISPPLVQIEESTVWNSDYRSLAQRIEQDKPKGVIMYSSGMIVPDALKKIMLTEVFSERYRVYLESKNKPPITKV